MAFWHRPTRFGWDASSLTDRPLALVLPVGKARFGGADVLQQKNDVVVG